jgi:lipoprotein-releasing system permease protein
MNYALYLSLKYLKPQKDKFFSYLSLAISICGIAIGVATLIVTLGVMTGFHREIKNRLSMLYPDIIVTSNYDISEEVLKSNKQIYSYSPFLYSQAILKFGDKVYTSVVKGINYDTEKKVVKIDKLIKWLDDNKLDKKSIVLGKELAKSLGVSFNDEVVMILPTQVQTPFGNLPLTEKFLVKGILSSGIYEYDSNLCFIDYNVATKIFYDNVTKQFNAIKCWGIKVNNEKVLYDVVSYLKTNLSPLTKILTWIELNYNFFTALKLEKIMMIIIVSLIIIVACFMIISNLLLKGLQKSKDIGILLAIGVSKKDVRKIFFLQGVTITLLGILLGAGLGFTLGLLIKQYQFITLPRGVYFIDKIPVYFSLPDIITTLAITIIVGIFASIYPAYKISQFDPVEIIRYG